MAGLWLIFYFFVIQFRLVATFSPQFPQRSQFINPKQSLQSSPKKKLKTNGLLVRQSCQSRSPVEHSSKLLPPHPGLKYGVLTNGLHYALLQNAAPQGRFEAHLEILAGSADEKEDQQGMAHLVEHIAYMGNCKREALFGTGSQTNAYTDFHHTVYFAACPVIDPSNPTDKRMMLYRALDALAEVLDAKFDESRLAKERAAVLSEMSMVNTIEYRIECEILKALHGENILAQRFPIGQKHRIENWSLEEVKLFYSEHYKPENAFLYLVGDLPVEQMEEQITQAMSRIASREFREPVASLRGVRNHQDVFTRKLPSLKLQSRHFPPIVHHWSGGGSGFDGTARIPMGASKPLDLNSIQEVEHSTCAAAISLRGGGGSGILRVFSHEMISRVSFHLFAKRPIIPVMTVNDLKKQLALKVALSALQVRLNVMSRQEPIFNYVELNELDSSREAARVCSLDMMCETDHWKQALEIVLKQIQSLATHGITTGEKKRFINAILADSEQIAAQDDTSVSSSLVTSLMEATACGHTHMHPHTSYVIAKEVLGTLSMEDIDHAAFELGAHILDQSMGRHPSAFVACTPASIQFSPQLIQNMMAEVRSSPVPEANLSSLTVPTTLLPRQHLPKGFNSIEPLSKEKVAQSFQPGVTELNQNLKVAMKKLWNGIALNYRCSQDEPQRASLRITVAGGRLAEAVSSTSSQQTSRVPFGALMLAARTMQEGGALGGLSRTQVELFCVDQLVMVEIATTEEFLELNFNFPTNKAAGEESVSGMEAVFQIMRQMFVPTSAQGFVWEQDAFERAKAGLIQLQETEAATLEGTAREAIVQKMVRGDARFDHLTLGSLDHLNLETVIEVMAAFLQPDKVSISISGDFSVSEVEELSVRYLGSLPPTDQSAMSTNQNIDALRAADVSATSVLEVEKKNDGVLRELLLSPFKEPEAGEITHIDLNIADSDPRALCLISGTSPSTWGIDNKGRDIRYTLGILPLSESDFAASLAYQSDVSNMISLNNLAPNVRRAQPLWSAACLAVLQEMVNRRLFSQVRERRQLTYDANFKINAHDRVGGGWWLVSVTSSPVSSQLALDASVQTLLELTPTKNKFGTSYPLSALDMHSAIYTLENKFNSDLQSNKNWVDMMSKSQLSSMPWLAPGEKAAVKQDWVATLRAVTISDINMMIQMLDFKEESMFTCIALSGGGTPAEQVGDRHGHTMPSLFRH